MTPHRSRIPDEHAARLSVLPEPLRAVLEAELAAGNEIVEVGSSFPAPPVGVYVKLARAVTTRPRADGDGISFHDRNGSSYSGEFHDEGRFHFILEPPHPPQPEPDMHAIRARLDAEHAAALVPPGADTAMDSGADADTNADKDADKDAVSRFRQSMVMDYEKWHDGIGYDLSVLAAATPAERAQIEGLLVARGVSDWRDAEALAALDSPAARAVLEDALRSGSTEIRLAVTRHAPDVGSDEQRVSSLVAALETTELFGGLSQALDEVPDIHPQRVLDALFRGALQRSGEVAVHFAAMLCFLHGKADEPFDWNQRPFFLRFHTEVRSEREAVFRELCGMIGVDAKKYLAP